VLELRQRVVAVGARRRRDRDAANQQGAEAMKQLDAANTDGSEGVAVTDLAQPEESLLRGSASLLQYWNDCSSAISRDLRGACGVVGLLGAIHALNFVAPDRIPGRR
jgi:hypothetical protein